MATITKSTKGAVYVINYHLVWRPKYRRSILTGEVARRLSELFLEIAGRWGMEMISQEVMPDHIHLFVSSPPKYSPAKITQLFKGTSSYIVDQKAASFPYTM